MQNEHKLFIISLSYVIIALKYYIGDGFSVLNRSWLLYSLFKTVEHAEFKIWYKFTLMI